MSNTLVINWSVWDRNPVVSWSWDGVSARVAFQRPPIAVCPLVVQGEMAIVGDFEECGSENLFVYSRAGALLRKYQAPTLGANAQFGSVREVDATLEVTVGYSGDQGQWVEAAGTLNTQDGSITDLHRGY